MIRVATLLLVLAALGTAATGLPQERSGLDRRMSFHNRLLLNRAAVTGVERIEVLLLAARRADGSGRASELAKVVRLIDGRVHRVDEAMGYMRVQVPAARLLELASSQALEAYQISSFSKGTWYRDTPPLANAQMFRNYEVTPLAAAAPSTSHADLPLLSHSESRAGGYTADDDVGVGEWNVRHPTFDGRGVTIALVENALPSFTDPTLAGAMTLDGRPVSKLAGILNTVDSSGPDKTRVVLDKRLHAKTTWASVENRTYILPRPGAYRFGVFTVRAGGNLVHRFAIIEDERTREVWMDANGDASFQDETPLADVNERFDPRFLKVAHPRAADVSFVMARGESPTLHIYTSAGSHQAMTASVAAGSRTDGSLASGVAPNARILFVRNSNSDYQLGDLFEGFIAAAKRPDVDVISASAGLTLVPDTSADFAGAFFRRLIEVYRKPVVNAGGNTQLELGTVFALGTGLSVGGTMGAATFGALYGGRPLTGLLVHLAGPAGPSLDGAIKPDFLAPMERISADLPWNRGLPAVPQRAPTRRLPAGYQISCCTSSSSPYAAGVIALLVSAAKQSNLSYSAETIGRALKTSAQFLPGFGSHLQGNGALDIEAAWRGLQNPVDVPVITASAGIVHPLAQYAARGPAGEGILEFEGWHAGTRGTREIRLRRDSGPRHPIRYAVSWTGNDGTFSTVSSVTLPLDAWVSVPLKIEVKSPGAHSALLDLRDESSGALIFRTQATVVASASINTSNGLVRMAGRVGPMRTNPHYVRIPAGTTAIAIDLEVTRGAVRPTILPSHGLFPSYYLHLHPLAVRFVGPGKYTAVFPNPEPGTWTIDVAGGSTWSRMEGDTSPASDEDADYAVTVRLLDAPLRTTGGFAESLALDVVNRGATIRSPVVEAWAGTLMSHRASFPANGSPRVFDISVPAGSATLSLDLRSDRPGDKVELFLYDCTTGECFSYDIGFPAAERHRMVVRRPAPGLWRAAVNAAPFPAAGGSFVLDELLTAGTPVRYVGAAPRATGARWQQKVNANPGDADRHGRTPVTLFELLDAATAQDEAAHPWDPSPLAPKIRDRPVALGTLIHRR